ERLPGFEHFRDRVILDWGPVARSWHQHLTNKPIIEITAPGRVLPPFNDYLEFSLTYEQMTALYGNADAHREWRSRLSAVAGVYLILAETTGKLYVGSASGAEGIWGRWREYVKSKHGNNVQLRELIESNKDYPKAFRFSILQIVPKSMTRQDVIAREIRFKKKLGCMAFGLNSN
ncbi:MAG: GIY-YIG nuclease family protein, partial [Candidatus Sulfotelmatobacter sp.]